jgi:hypothetical protein
MHNQSLHHTTQIHWTYRYFQITLRNLHLHVCLTEITRTSYIWQQTVLEVQVSNLVAKSIVLFKMQCHKNMPYQKLELIWYSFKRNVLRTWYFRIFPYLLHFQLLIAQIVMKSEHQETPYSTTLHAPIHTTDTGLWYGSQLHTFIAWISVSDHPWLPRKLNGTLTLQCGGKF